jgi:DNA-binding MarR family transcriptional regulator
LGRSLSISKQAAAKTIAVLEERGYLERGADPGNARRKPLLVTTRGFAMLREAEAIFDDLRRQWARQIGSAELKTLEKHLSALVGPTRVRLDDMPGWVSRGLGE